MASPATAITLFTAFTHRVHRIMPVFSNILPVASQIIQPSAYTHHHHHGDGLCDCCSLPVEESAEDLLKYDVSEETLLRFSESTAAPARPSAGKVREEANPFMKQKMIRDRMKARGLKKVPGKSWIEIEGRTHTFFANDSNHDRYPEIRDKLEELKEQIRNEGGYEEDTSWVLHDLPMDTKKERIWNHSERLAVGLGMLYTPHGSPLLIAKNLRICGDCHVAMKHISKYTERKLTIRDNKRFHHFFEGHCSCGDYW